MDIIAHALWANLAGEVVTRRKRVALRRSARTEAMLGGVLPDFIPFLPYLFASIFGSGGLIAYFFQRFGQEWGFGGVNEKLATIPDWMQTVYAYTHSGLLWCIAAVLLYLILKRMPFWLLGWGTHIALDIFTHDAGHFPTRILYPLSDFHINATSWSNPIVFVCTYVALLLCYLAVYTRRTHRPHRTNHS